MTLISHSLSSALTHRALRPARCRAYSLSSAVLECVATKVGRLLLRMHVLASGGGVVYTHTTFARGNLSCRRLIYHK